MNETEVLPWVDAAWRYGVGGALLVGSYFRLWMWRKDHDDIVKGKDERIAELKAECDELKGMLHGLVPSLSGALTNTVASGRRGERG